MSEYPMTQEHDWPNRLQRAVREGNDFPVENQNENENPVQNGNEFPVEKPVEVDWPMALETLALGLGYITILLVVLGAIAGLAALVWSILGWWSYLALWGTGLVAWLWTTSPEWIKIK